MANPGVQYIFSAMIRYSEWYFVSMPKDMSEEIRTNFKDLEEGWGRLKATAKIGNSEWKTAIWFDTKQQTYLLPIKALIRKNEKIGADSQVKVSVWI